PVDFVLGVTRSTQKNKGDARRTRPSFLSIYGYQGCWLSREEKTTTAGHKQGLSSAGAQGVSILFLFPDLLFPTT
ncbi:hypothetical protein P4S91_25660, partial [Aneurinibacillus aneurinilyticus]|nr:hypothetical protein [Aneurinibacillus aneurinilyticus]